MYAYLLILLLILLAIFYYSPQPGREGMSSMIANSSAECPNVLIQKGSQFFLYNTNVAEVPGVNPVQFQNLEDYTEFIDWQRSQGIRCPVLYLQQSYDTQGESVYRVRPSPYDLQGGLPPSNPHLQYPNPTKLIDATRDDYPYNTNSLPGFDASSQYEGATTPLDLMNQEEEGLLFSPNPMNANWGGPQYTQKLVDTGYYDNNNVNLWVGR
jgi:hypothetical protein